MSLSTLPSALAPASSLSRKSGSGASGRKESTNQNGNADFSSFLSQVNDNDRRK